MSCHIVNNPDNSDDREMAPMIKIMSDTSKDNRIAVKCIALQMIYAVGQQIPELKDYWPELYLP